MSSQEIDLLVLKRVMSNVIADYVPSVEKFDTVSDDPKEASKELARFMISELAPQLQDALEKALDPEMDMDTFMRLHNLKMIISDD